MAIVVTEKERIRRLEQEKAALLEENINLRGVIEYIALMDYPEILEDEEEENDD